MLITGTFDVVLTPVDAYAKGINGVNLGRMTLDKTFYGDLAAKSQGEMLSAMTSIKGSAGYVAIEQVVGAISGKQGSFVLQHFGMMNDGLDRLVLEIVPNSGAGELSGIAGTMTIKMDNGQHFYELDYELDSPMAP